MNNLRELIEISRRYGTNKGMVLAGGGNTSEKDNHVMYIKASGHELATIDESGFVKMDLVKLHAVWTNTYAENTKDRETQVLADMMDARCEGEHARPSVEALLHSIIPHRFVVHLHPGLVNGVTCSCSGKETISGLFGDRAVWIPLVNPGYILAKTVKDVVSVHEKKTGGYPRMLFLQNHGVFVSADTITGVDELYDEIMNRLSEALIRVPDLTVLPIDQHRKQIVASAMKDYYRTSEEPYELMNSELAARLKDAASFIPISSAFTPDHIVYSGFKPLWVDEGLFRAADPAAALKRLFSAYEEQYGVIPKSVVVQNTGVFTVEERAMILYLDTVRIAAYAESFGGARFMDEDQISFIRNWEVEKYRAKVHAS